MRVEWTTSELKESLLVVLAIVWGAILLLPGNTFANPSRVDLMSTYATDTVWGTLLLLVCVPFLFINRYRHRNYRRFLHAFLWTFWLGITVLAVWRSSDDGLAPTDFLISLPFLTIALMHGIVYAGLGIKKK